jgi:hypothetical protein
MTVTMRSSIKVVFGASLLTAGIYLSATSLESLIDLSRTVVGPVMILLGAFLVWLESDSWKDDAYADQGREELAQRDTVDYDSILDGTVNEVRQEVVNSEDDMDISTLMTKEKEGKNRKTLLDFLERRLSQD